MYWINSCPSWAHLSLRRVLPTSTNSGNPCSLAGSLTLTLKSSWPPPSSTLREWLTFVRSSSKTSLQQTSKLFMYVLNVTILKKSPMSRETLRPNSHASISPSSSTKYTTGLSTLWELSMQSSSAVQMGKAELRFWWPVLIFLRITLSITIWSRLCIIQWQRLSLYTSLSTPCLPQDKAELSPLFRTLFYTELGTLQGAL